MTSFFHDLEEQLRSAARRQTSGATEPSPETPVHSPPPRRRWRWLAGGARALPVAVAVAVTLAVVVGALVLLGHRGGQSPTPPASGGGGNAFATLILKTPKAQLRRELALIGTATKAVQHSAACRVPQPLTAPQVHGVPGRELLSALGVLRRPATAADHVPRGSISAMGPGISVYAGAARRVATIAGTSYYIVPIRQDPAAGVPSSRCFALQKAALAKALPTFPEALRAPIRQLAASLIAYTTSLAAKPPGDAICELTVDRNGGGTSCGETADQIRRGLFPNNDNGTFSGPVPDGVATVTLHFSAVPGRPARTLTATVHGNVYAVRTGLTGPPTPGSPTVVWHAADGHVLHTYSEAAPGGLRNLCRQRPEACIEAVLVEGGGPEVSASSSSSSGSATATTQSRPSSGPTTPGG